MTESIGVIEKLESQWSQEKFLCVGVDPVIAEGSFGQGEDALYIASADIIKATKNVAAAYKPNSAFFEREERGLETLALVTEYIRTEAPDVPIIWDSKRGDIGNTNSGYNDALERIGADAITLSPYLGGTALQPLLSNPERMGIVLVKTSNPDSGEFQDLELVEGGKLWERVAFDVANDSDKWHHGSPLGIVVGATYPETIARARKIVGDDVTILVPGVGTQGGDLEASVRGAANSRRSGFLINVSSGISQPKDSKGEKIPTPSVTNMREAAENFDMKIKSAKLKVQWS